MAASNLESHIGVPVNTSSQIPLVSNQQLQIGAKIYQAQVLSTLPQLVVVGVNTTPIPQACNLCPKRLLILSRLTGLLTSPPRRGWGWVGLGVGDF